MNKTNTLIPIQSDSIQIIPHVQKVSEFMQFAQWLAMPSQLREPKTQKNFTRSIGVNQDTLTDWKKYSQLWNLVHQQTNSRIKEQVPDVIQGLYRNACKEGRAKDVLTFLQLAGINLN